MVRESIERECEKEERWAVTDVKGAVGNKQTVPKPRSEWKDEDIEQVHKDKKAMNILFNGLDGDMFDNVINCSTAKEIWDQIQGLCEGTEQDDMDDIDEHLAILSKSFEKLKFKRNFGAAKSNRNMVDKAKFKCFKYGMNGHFSKEKAFITQQSDWADDGEDADEDMNYINLALMAKSDETEKEEILRKYLECEQEVIKAWKLSRDVSAQIAKVQRFESFCEEAWRKNKKKLDQKLVDGLSKDVESTDDEAYPLKDEARLLKVVSHLLNEKKTINKGELAKLNEKYGSVTKNFVQGESSKAKDASRVNVGHLLMKQLSDRLEKIEVKADSKRKNNKNGKVGINKHNNYTPDKYAPRNICVKCGFQIPTPKTKVDSQSPKSNDGKTKKLKKKANKGNKKNFWYLDSGFSRHMTGDSILLTEFKERAGPSITFGDDSKGYNMGYGLISRENVIIEEFALVDGLKHNLLSVSQLCDKGNYVTLTTEACVVICNKNNKVVFTGVRKGNVYLAYFSSKNADSITCLFIKASQDESWIWHKKLSHLNFNTMNELVMKDLVRVIPQVEFSKDGLCGACQKGNK
ncbi:hypothetical protein AgCh_001367 [Apium graveolens]